MKFSVLVLTGAISAVAFGALAAPTMLLGSSVHSDLVQQAHVTCAYLTRDGYCVRPRKVDKRHNVRHWRPNQRAYRTYEPSYQYYRRDEPRAVIRIVPNYPPRNDDYWDDGSDNGWNGGWDD